MKRIIYIILFPVVLLYFSGCAYQQYTMLDAYPKLYETPPASILILPPVNNSTAVEAKEYFACSLAEAVGSKGYYTFPVEAVFSVLRDEGLYDTEIYTPEILANLYKYFHADAVLLTSIEKWDKSWALTSGTLQIDAKYTLLSTTTGEIIWDFISHTDVELSSSSDNLLISMVESAVKTAIEDYFPNCLAANKETMKKGLPYGKHHPSFGTDTGNSIPTGKVIEIYINK